jgi:3-dehydroquinate synthase
LCSQDKKNEGSTVNFSLLRRIGNCDYNITGTSAEEIKEAIAYYQTLSSQVPLNQ